jgi:hypothetical protein
MINSLKKAILGVAMVSAGVANAGTYLDFTTLMPTSISNPGNPVCGFNSGSDVCGTSMTFTQGLISAVATATYLGSATNGTVPVRVVQDFNGSKPTYVGLGVYHELGNTADDNITLNEVLTIAFNDTVTLTGLNFLADGHVAKFAAGDAFLLNDTGTHFGTNGSISNLSLTGKVFNFGYGAGGLEGANAMQYYLGGLMVSAVPEPETFTLMLAGLGLMGVVARRRKANQA